jgi:hypothetical protein
MRLRRRQEVLSVKVKVVASTYESPVPHPLGCGNCKYKNWDFALEAPLDGRNTKLDIIIQTQEIVVGNPVVGSILQP